MDIADPIRREIKTQVGYTETLKSEPIAFSFSSLYPRFSSASQAIFLEIRFRPAAKI